MHTYISSAFVLGLLVLDAVWGAPYGSLESRESTVPLEAILFLLTFGAAVIFVASEQKKKSLRRRKPHVRQSPPLPGDVYYNAFYVS